MTVTLTPVERDDLPQLFRLTVTDAQAAYLWRLLVGAQHQNKGIGRAAMGLALDWARGRGNPSMTTSTVEANAVALRFYQSLGFARTGAIVNGEVVLARSL